MPTDHSLPPLVDQLPKLDVAGSTPVARLARHPPLAATRIGPAGSRRPSILRAHAFRRVARPDFGPADVADLRQRHAPQLASRYPPCERHTRSVPSNARLTFTKSFLEMPRVFFESMALMIWSSNS